MSRTRNYSLWIAITLVVLYVGAGGLGKLAGSPDLHSSFQKLDLPDWFAYFIGVCELLGAMGLLIRPLRALAAVGIGIIMIGAIYYHAVHTPIAQAGPALILTVLCVYIFFKTRAAMFRFGARQQAAEDRH